MKSTIAVLLLAATLSLIASPAADLHALAGKHARVVWARDTKDGCHDTWATQSGILLMGLDSEDGRGERAILPDTGSYHLPLLTRDGTRVVYTDNHDDGTVYVVGFDGQNKRKVAQHGTAVDVWKDPADDTEWVYIWCAGDGHQCIRRITLEGAPDRDARQGELVWGRTPVEKHSFDLSRDGRHASSQFPWPHAYSVELPDGNASRYGSGCWTSMAPDNSLYTWVFDGDHRSVHLRGPGDVKRRIDIHDAPGVNGWEVYHPRWTNHPRFIVMTGPYTGGSMGGNNIGNGGPDVEVYVGRFDEGYTRIEAWARITDDKNGDFIPDAWIEGGESANILDTLSVAERKRLEELDRLADEAARLREAAFKPASDMDGPWPCSHTGLVYAWGGKDADNTVRNPALGDSLCRPSVHGKVSFDEDGSANLSGGSLVAEDGAQKLLDACRASNQLSVEAVFTSETLDQRGPTRIISFSSNCYERNFTLGQQDNHVIMRLRTPRTGDNGVNPETNLFEIEPGRKYHVVVSYAPGEMRCYVDGKQVLSTTSVQGDFSNWTMHTLLFGDEIRDSRDWKGRLHGASLYSRAIGPEEAARKFDAWQNRK